MEIVNAVDYSPHLLEAQRVLKELHRALNEHRNDEAKELIMLLQTEVRLLNTAIKATE